ncbi:MAG TPA: hypothetical protein VG452_06560 [Egibacteraceae bacterium]|nr:hypothetical protein [Actinomycetota bacterium]HWB71860.1 hypothetical protein [Egibacteraceae bacterium]
MKPSRLVRRALGSALSATSQVLAAASRLSGQLASLARPPGNTHDDVTAPGPVGPVGVDDVLEPLESPPDTRDRAESLQRATDVDTRVETPPTVPAPEGPDRVRSPETHIAELAEGSADEVVRALPGLSTDELRLLYEHETSHQSRPSVLDAVERALSPG